MEHPPASDVDVTPLVDRLMSLLVNWREIQGAGYRSATLSGPLPIPQRRRPAGVASRKRIRVLFQLENDIDPGPWRQFGGAAGEVPGFHPDDPAVLTHRNSGVLLFHPERLAGDLHA